MCFITEKTLSEPSPDLCPSSQSYTENRLTMAMWKSSDKESWFYGYHGTLVTKREKDRVCECVCVSLMWVTSPCLMAPCCVPRPALSCSPLSHSRTQTNAYTQQGRDFWGVPHPNTLNNTPAPLHLLLLFLKVICLTWSLCSAYNIHALSLSPFLSV